MESANFEQLLCFMDVPEEAVTSPDTVVTALNELRASIEQSELKAQIRHEELMQVLRVRNLELKNTYTHTYSGLLQNASFLGTHSSTVHFRSSAQPTPSRHPNIAQSTPQQQQHLTRKSGSVVAREQKDSL